MTRALAKLAGVALVGLAVFGRRLSVDAQLEGLRADVARVENDTADTLASMQESINELDSRERVGF